MTSAEFETDDLLPGAIRDNQEAAAAGRRSSDLLGNFGDFDSLFAQLSEPPLIELGDPLPQSKYMPRTRVGTCPAAHNRALLKEGD